MRYVKSKLTPSIPLLWAAIWVIAITVLTSQAHAEFRQPPVRPTALAPVLETKILVQSDEDPRSEYVDPDTPDPLRLSSPRISPRGIAPGVKRAVTFRTLITGVSKPPPVLYLDRVSNRGEFISKETELRDDGKEPDTKAGDGFYSGRLELGSEEETEIYFRLRTEYFGKTVTSGIAVFPITRLPLGSRPSPGPLVDHPNGQGKIFTNEVLIGALAGVSPRRVQTIVTEVGVTLGLEPEDIGIAGYIPSLDSYLVEFKGEGSLQEVNRAISAFSTYAEVKYASHSVRGNPAATPWLSNIMVETLRGASLPAGLPVDGSGIMVAIIDNGVNCTDLDLTGRCATRASVLATTGWITTDSCAISYNESPSLPISSSTHGTKVAALLAGAQGTANTIQGVDEGVAWGVTLLPFGPPPTQGLQQQQAASAMECAITAGADILNISYEWEFDDTSVSPTGVLHDAVCSAVCDNKLVVAAAGNGACPPSEGGLGYRPHFPASYDDATSCVCGAVDTRAADDYMLKVGGTDLLDNEGDWCVAGTTNLKSQLGEIYAPGWGVPHTDETNSDCLSNSCYGTSWSAPLVSACAAIVGAVQRWKVPTWVWDPTFIESRLLSTSTISVTRSDTPPTSAPLMNCFAAVLGYPPTATNLSAGETYTEDTPLNLTDIVVSDADGDPVTVTLTLSDTAAGSLSTGTSGAVTSTYDTGTGVWSASGAITDVNTLLAGVTFTPAPDYNSSFTIGTSVDDGVAAAITGTKSMTGTPQNDAPTATNLSAGETYTEDIALDLTDILVTDVDGDPVTVTLTLSVPAAGSLNTGTSGAVTSTYDTGTGVWSASGAITDVNTLLAGVTFTPAPDYNSSFTIGTSVDDGVAAAITGTKSMIGTPVNDFDIVFVLDRSGSMRLPTDTHPTRWGALTEAVKGFMPLIYTVVVPDSNFGLTLFASRVLTFTDPDPRFKLNDNDFSGLVSIDAGLSGKVLTELNSQDTNVYGATAMGAGLKDGRDKMTNTLRPRVVVLFTDGEQNIPPEVDIGGCTFSDGSFVNPNCPSIAGSVKIITVGIGNPSGAYLSTLQALAWNNGGPSIITSDGATFSGDVSVSTIGEAFEQAIAPALAGNSPQVVTSYRGTLSNIVTLPPFDLNKNVSQLLINISFNRKFKTSDMLSLLSGVRIMKDGIDIMHYFKPVFPSNYTNSVLLKTNFVYKEEDKTSTIAPEGSYAVEMTAPAVHGPDLGYRVVPYADDHRLDMDWQVSPGSPRVNQSFNPTISLSWRGSPVTNANVEAWILKPGGDMGDVLAQDPQKVDPSSAPDAGSPGYQKYLYLRENDPNFLAKLHPNEQKLTLAHRGGGEYSASYNPGDVSGIYQVLYRVSVEDEELGKVQRQAVQSVYVRFGDIDLDESAVNTQVSGNTVTINFRPITTYGRFIGPAQASAFSVDGTDIELSKITDHQDGSYTLILTGNPDAQISLKLLGEEIYQGPAKGFGKKGLWERLCDWLIWLIIVLFILLLIWVIWRLTGGGSSP